MVDYTSCYNVHNWYDISLKSEKQGAKIIHFVNHKETNNITNIKFKITISLSLLQHLSHCYGFTFPRYASSHL